MPKCLFVVRATVADPAKRAAFDAWYKHEHLPDAAKSFGAQKAWRCWSGGPAPLLPTPSGVGSDR